MSKLCVIVEGQLRGSQRCGPNIRRHLIDALGADLMIYAQHTPEYHTDECAKRYGPAVSYHAYENPTPDFSEIFDALRTEYGYDFDWRDMFKMVKSSNYHLGFSEPGTCIRRMYSRHLLYKTLQNADYDWYILIRSDMYFLDDFPIHHCQDPNLLYSAATGRYKGINNNLLVFGASLREAVLNYITLFLDGSLARLGNKNVPPQGMGEEVFFKRAMDLQNVNEGAAIPQNWFISADSTNELVTWKHSHIYRHPNGLLYKYEDEFMAAFKNAGVPLSSSSSASTVHTPPALSATPPPVA